MLAVNAENIGALIPAIDLGQTTIRAAAYDFACHEHTPAKYVRQYRKRVGKFANVPPDGPTDPLVSPSVPEEPQRGQEDPEEPDDGYVPVIHHMNVQELSAPGSMAHPLRITAVRVAEAEWLTDDEFAAKHQAKLPSNGSVGLLDL